MESAEEEPEFHACLIMFCSQWEEFIPRELRDGGGTGFDRESVGELSGKCSPNIWGLLDDCCAGFGAVERAACCAEATAAIAVKMMHRYRNRKYILRAG